MAHDMHEFGYDDYDGYEDHNDRCDFADPGGNSSLRAATRSNPRNLPCGTCGTPNRLTPADIHRGYCCDRCADAMENGGEIDYYDDDKSHAPSEWPE